MKKHFYTTSKIVLQMRLAGIEGVKINRFGEEIEYCGKKYKDIVFEYPEDLRDEVEKEIQAFRLKEEIKDFEELKSKRKQLINEYYDRKQGGRVDLQ